MGVKKREIVSTLASKVASTTDLGTTAPIRAALAPIIGRAINKLNTATGNRGQTYTGEQVEKIFDTIENDINGNDGIKIGRTGKILSKANLADTLSELRDNRSRLNRR